MITKKDFIFVRHGETEGNKKNICQGKSNFPLTELGRQQAVEAARRLKPYYPIQKIYSSDLGRAVETATILRDLCGCPPVIFHAGLQERGYGDLEGQLNVKMFEQEAWEIDPSSTCKPVINGLEELPEFSARILKTMNLILSEPMEAVPVIVGHGRFFFALCPLLGCEPIKQIPNGVPLYCRCDGKSWQVAFLDS